MSNIKLGDDFTNAVIAATGPKADPRVRTVFASLIRHLHDFTRENQITVDEWTKAVSLMNRAGQMSNEKRNEGQLVCDVLGLESLVDDITNSLLVGESYEATATAILGPFYRDDTPAIPNDASIVLTPPKDGKGENVYMHGIVTDAATGKPIPGAKIDIWQCSTNGMYEQQDPDQAEWNLRGKLTTDENGYYGVYCIRPVPYPIPYDGPAGDLLQLLDRHPWRPGHIHLLIGINGYAPLTTQIFDRTSKYLIDDSVFAVKDELLVDFKPIQDNPKAELELVYDVKLAPSKA
ncbi:hypothetical protein V2G26_011283 [Clonostachys chloroleuca]|uniref:Hydroxyquinol 1,2-dioxygenase n=1 Tax=Clonostachys chloroleuca TaxID=1926264 RepID=A0AA35PVC0_9HYPO|nr:unnamed protein product [Clonostachys chloroleuca]